MYGMVNQGVRTFIIENYGEDDWRDLCRTADLKEDRFESMATYPDDVTYRLVGAISEKYELTPAQVLEVFGDYWVDYSGKSEIGQLMRFGGKELTERLYNLNEMHERIKMTMPNLKPPSFEFEEHEDGRCSLHYFSDREGLEPMVIGLLKGLSRETGEPVSIVQDETPGVEDARASFTITFVD